MHDNFVALATRLIKKHGRTIHLKTLKNSEAPWDPVRGTGSLVPVIGVQTKYSTDEVDGVNILTADKKFIIDSSVEPSLDMRILDDKDILYKIVMIDELKPGDSTIMYMVQARI